MTKDTLRNTLRNAVINETVNNLTQSICNQAVQAERPAPRVPACGLVLAGGLRRYRDPLRATEHRPAARGGRASACPRPGRRAAPPQCPRRRMAPRGARSVVPLARGGRHAGPRVASESAVVDPLEEIGDLVVTQGLRAPGRPPARRTRRIRRSRRAGGTNVLHVADDPGSRRRKTIDDPRLRPPDPGRGRQPPAQARHGRPGLQPQAPRI